MQRRPLADILNAFKDITKIFRAYSFRSSKFYFSSVSEYGGISATVSQSQETSEVRSLDLTTSSISIWLQFTIPSITYRMTGRLSGSHRRLSICMEDTSVSLDSQSSYTKLILRMRKMSSLSQEFADGEWKVSNCPVSNPVTNYE